MGAVNLAKLTFGYFFYANRTPHHPITTTISQSTVATGRASTQHSVTSYEFYRLREKAGIGAF